MFCHKPGEVVFEDGAPKKMDLLKNEVYDSLRKTLNAVTQRSNLVKKNLEGAKQLKKRVGHMKLRANQVIFHKCIKELDGSVCPDCKKKSHKIPLAVIKDLPKQSLGDGALWWDITLDPEKPGGK